MTGSLFRSRPASGRPMFTRRRRLFVMAALLMSAASCSRPQPVLMQLMEARRLSAELRSSFSKANEASNRAVLADTDDVSAAAAKEAAEATSATVRTLAKLQQDVNSLGYTAEQASLERFATRFDEFQKLDQEILTLAVENTNLKAQRLSFGAAREMGEAIASELTGYAASGPAESAVDAQAIRADVFQMLFIEARHIVEADEPTMTALEREAAMLADDARVRLGRLKGRARGGAEQVDAAASLFTRFMATHEEVVALSRRNTNVRSLALTLGRKRVVVADCEAELDALQQALAMHGSEATR